MADGGVRLTRLAAAVAIGAAATTTAAVLDAASVGGASAEAGPVVGGEDAADPPFRAGRGVPPPVTSAWKEEAAQPGAAVPDGRVGGCGGHDTGFAATLTTVGSWVTVLDVVSEVGGGDGGAVVSVRRRGMCDCRSHTADSHGRGVLDDLKGGEGRGESGQRSY